MAEALLKYNNTELFESVSVTGGEISFPTPYVSRSKNINYQNEQQTEITSWTLNGSFYISENDGTETRPKMLGEGRASLIQFFKQNFKKFESDQGTSDMVMIKSVAFDNTNYASMVSYSVVLENVADIGWDNVGEIQDEWSWKEAGSGFSSLTHSVSAKGIMPSNVNWVSSLDSDAGKTSALYDAKDWVKKRLSGPNSSGTGWRLGNVPNVSIPLPAFIDVTANTTLIKTSETEKINRMAARYSVVETFQFLPSYRDLPGMQTFTADYPVANIATLGNDDPLPALVKWTFDEEESSSSDEVAMLVTAEVFIGKDRATSGNDPDWAVIQSIEAIAAAPGLGSGGGFINVSHAAWYWARQYGGGKENHAQPEAMFGQTPTAPPMWGRRDLNLYYNNVVSMEIDQEAGRVVYQFKFDNNRLYRDLTWTNFVKQAEGNWDFNGTPVLRAYSDPEATMFEYTASVTNSKVRGTTAVTIQGELFTDPTLPMTRRIEILTYFITQHSSENAGVMAGLIGNTPWTAAGQNSYWLGGSGYALSHYLYNLAKEKYTLVKSMHEKNPAMQGFYTEYRKAKSSIDFEAGNFPDASSQLPWLNPYPQNLSISINKTQGTASVNATFDDEDYLFGVRRATYNMSVKPPLTPYVPKQSVNKSDGAQIIFDPGGDRRGNVTCSVKLEGTDTFPIHDAEVSRMERNILMAFKNQDQLLKEADTYSKTEDEDSNISSTFTYSFQGAVGQNFYDGDGTFGFASTTSERAGSARNIDQKLWPLPPPTP